LDELKGDRKAVLTDKFSFKIMGVPTIAEFLTFKEYYIYPPYIIDTSQFVKEAQLLVDSFLKR
jgi:hypothetical protein